MKESQGKPRDDGVATTQNSCYYDLLQTLHPETSSIQDLQALELYRPLASTVLTVSASSDLLCGIYCSHSTHSPADSIYQPPSSNVNSRKQR